MLTWEIIPLIKITMIQKYQSIHLFAYSKYKTGISSNYEKIIKLQSTICGDFYSCIYIDYM